MIRLITNYTAHGCRRVRMSSVKQTPNKILIHCDVIVD